MVAPLERCNEEANNLLGPSLQAYSSLHINISLKEMDYGELVCSGPEYPPGLEDYIGVFGSSDRAQVQYMSNENIVHENSLEKGNEAH